MCQGGANGARWEDQMNQRNSLSLGAKQGHTSVISHCNTDTPGLAVWFGIPSSLIPLLETSTS